jgi:arylsulfatase A-like enzyme
MRRWILPLTSFAVMMIASLASQSDLGQGYPNQLAATSALAVVAATLFVQSLVGPVPSSGSLRAVSGLVLGAVALGGLALLLNASTKDVERRWELALHHGHVSYWTELARKGFDEDGDGFSTVLGGGDCDDSDPSIHPAAGDEPDNGIDENCDGEDALSAAMPLPDHVGYDDQIATWLESELVRGFLAKTEEMNIVVVFVDTLRADMLFDTDDNRTDFPRLFELLDQSRVFDYAFSPAAGTDVAMASLLTGRIDPFVRIQTTLFEAMSQSGRSVLGVFPGEVLRWAGTNLIKRGLTRVVEVKTDRDKPNHGSHSASIDTTEQGLGLLGDALEQRTSFLWLHYFDVHEHLQLPSSSPSILGLLNANGEETTDRIDKYRATLKLVDGGIGLLQDELRKNGRWENTIVVLASDHGESMLEDPRLPKAHGLFVYNPLVHVPFAIRVPGVAPAKIMTPVALTDLTPTLTALSGAKGLEDTEAHTLLHHIIDDEESSVDELGWPILLHEQNQWAILDWPFKLLVRPQDNLKELYDLSSDFEEKKDLSFLHPEKVRALEQLRQQYPAFQVVRTMDIIRQREGLAEAP